MKLLEKGKRDVYDSVHMTYSRLFLETDRDRADALETSSTHAFMLGALHGLRARALFASLIC